MNKDFKDRLFRFLLYLLVGFLAAFLYNYLKK
jgi:hypothetical protein